MELSTKTKALKHGYSKNDDTSLEIRIKQAYTNLIISISYLLGWLAVVDIAKMCMRSKNNRNHW